MGHLKPALLVSMFAVFFVASYIFIIENISILYWTSVAVGTAALPVTLILYRKETSSDFHSSILYFIILLISLGALLLFISSVNFRWASTIPEIFVTPVLVEQFNFRYLVQRILLRKYSPYAVISLQAVLYSLYYSKYVVAGRGIGFPFPYNVIMITSMFGMGLLYGLLSKVSKNFFLPATVQLIIWSLFPWLPAALASTIVPA